MSLKNDYMTSLFEQLEKNRLEHVKSINRVYYLISLAELFSKEWCELQNQRVTLLRHYYNNY